MRSVVVVPTYNEAENVRRLVAEVHTVVPELHVLVADNASPDGTGRIVQELAERDRRVRLLPLSGQRGFAQAYVSGFKDCIAQGYDVIVQMDCDLSHQPRYLPEFLRWVGEYDTVIGSRYTAGGGTERWPLRREILSRGGNVYAKSILRLPLADLTGGFKCWRRQALEAIDLDGLMAHGFAFQMEMNYRAWKAGLRMKEIPIVFPDRTEGESKMMVHEFWESISMPWRLRQLRL